MPLGTYTTLRDSTARSGGRRPGSRPEDVEEQSDPETSIAAIAAVAADLAARSSLSVSDFEDAVRLQEAGGEQVQLALGESLAWSASRLSHQLRRMEQRGLVTRAGAGHGRSVLVRLTEAGGTELATASAVHARAVREHFLDGPAGG